MLETVQALLAYRFRSDVPHTATSSRTLPDDVKCFYGHQREGGKFNTGLYFQYALRNSQDPRLTAYFDVEWFGLDGTWKTISGQSDASIDIERIHPRLVNQTGMSQDELLSLILLSDGGQHDAKELTTQSQVVDGALSRFARLDWPPEGSHAREKYGITAIQVASSYYTTPATLFANLAPPGSQFFAIVNVDGKNATAFVKRDEDGVVHVTVNETKAWDAAVKLYFYDAYDLAGLADMRRLAESMHCQAFQNTWMSDDDRVKEFFTVPVQMAFHIDAHLLSKYEGRYCVMYPDPPTIALLVVSTDPDEVIAFDHDGQPMQESWDKNADAVYSLTHKPSVDALLQSKDAASIVQLLSNVEKQHLNGIDKRLLQTSG